MNRSILCSILAEKECELSSSTLFVIAALAILFALILVRRFR